jgi:hypothetical protein
MYEKPASDKSGTSARLGISESDSKSYNKSSNDSFVGIFVSTIFAHCKSTTLKFMHT